MITFQHKGDFSKTTRFLERSLEVMKSGKLDVYAQEGVDALARSTPKKSGKTAASWDYRIKNDGNRIAIEWFNTNIQNGVNIAVLIQYGHGTGWGGYVKGIDYINPAMRPVFNNIVEKVCQEVKRA